MTDAPEFSRPFRLDVLGGEPRAVAIVADEAERAALATRFGLIGIAGLEASATIRRDGQTVYAVGQMRAEATQACVATGDPVAARVDEPFALRFDPAGTESVADERELEENDLDVLAYEGGAIDLGEAVAQGFALALDPFPRSPEAGRTLRDAGVLSEEEAEAAKREASPFAMLKGVVKD